MSDKDRVLITGASAGIGHALADVFAARGHNLVLVARREAELEALAVRLRAEYNVEVLVQPADLAVDDAARELAAALADTPIGILVNNAGVLNGGAFRKMEDAAIDSMLDVNIKGLTKLCREFLEPMIERGQGRIMNVASIAAFQPVPTLAVYAATKAYVLSFGEALAAEVARHGVTVTTLCPGFTDTAMLRDPKTGSSQVPDVLVMTPQQVARIAYRACMAGKTVEVAGLANSAGATVSRFLPRWLVRRATRVALG